MKCTPLGAHLSVGAVNMCVFRPSDIPRRFQIEDPTPADPNAKRRYAERVVSQLLHNATRRQTCLMFGGVAVGTSNRQPISSTIWDQTILINPTAILEMTWRPPHRFTTAFQNEQPCHPEKAARQYMNSSRQLSKGATW